MGNIKYLNLSYNDFDNLLNRLIKKLREREETIPNLIYAPPRGGLCIAVPLSHEFNCSMLLQPIGVFDYLQIYPMRLLIVDDVCDSGKTLKNVTNFFTTTSYDLARGDSDTCITATLHKKPRSNDIFTPDIFLEEVENDVWIKYPWERNSSVDKDYMLK